MKRFLHFMLIAVLVSASAFAAAPAKQKIPHKESHLSLRAYYNATTSTVVPEIIKFGPGVSVGMVYMCQFGKLPFAQFGALFDYNTFKLDGTTANRYNPITYNGHVTCVGVNIPVNLGLKFYGNNFLKLYAYTGPNFFVNFTTRGHYDMIYANSTVRKDDEKITTTGMDLGWMLGLGADVFEKVHVCVEGTYGLSNWAMMKDLELGKHSHTKRAVISVGIGYNF